MAFLWICRFVNFLALACLLSWIPAAEAAADSGSSTNADPPPHILFVLVDDLGWGDVGFHRGDARITPRMNELVAEGLELHRHMVHHSCSGTRTALQSGRFPVHVQTTLKNPDNPSSGMPRNLTGFAEYMKQKNYSSAFVGKWDVGMATPKHTPHGRGYDTSLNYFEHKNDYWTQACLQSACCTMLTQDNKEIKDLWDTDKPARSLVETDYEELIFQQRMFEIIDQHAAEKAQQPLFLFYSPHVAHCPLQVPLQYLEQFDWMDDDEDMCKAETDSIVGPNGTVPYSCRKQYFAMVKLLDDIIGSLVDRFKQHGMWDRTLLVFTSDNGGPVDPTESAATNFPLRGGKYSDFEGGVRAVAFVSGGYIPEKRRGMNVTDPIHICDWYATIPALAGIDVHHEEKLKGANSNQKVPPLDSVNVWPLIVGEGDTVQNKKREIPLSHDALMIGDYKLLWNEKKNITLAGYTGFNYPNNRTGKHEIRQESINCSTGCLFNVDADPGEHNDIAGTENERVEAMKARLVELRLGFYDNDETGIDSCPKGFNDDDKDLLCACWMAVNYYGGFLGPFQEIDMTNSFTTSQS